MRLTRIIIGVLSVLVIGGVASAEGRLVVRASKKYAKMDAHFKKVTGVPYRPSKDVDTDGDGLNDLAEIAALSNPFDPDTDGDGIPDPRDPAPLVAKGGGEFPGAYVRRINGVPTFVIGGKPEPLTALFGGGAVYPPALEKMGECGIKIFQLKWRTPEPADRVGAYSDLDRDIDKLVRAVPDCKIIIRLLVRESRWFARTFPDDLQVYSDGTTKWVRDNYGSFHLHSWASEAWTSAISGELVRLVNHLRLGPYAANMAGFQICAGNTYEWWYSNYPGKSWDYGPAFQHAFRKHMKDKYQTLNRLNKAWKTNLKVFGDIELPMPAEKMSFNKYGYFDPESQRKVVDYWECFHQFLTDDVLYFSRVVKAASGGKLLVGFEIQGAGMTALQNGNYRTRILHKTPTVDFRAAPSVYLNRAPGGTAPLRIESASMVLANKVWFNENDFRTHKTPTKKVSYNEGNETAEKSVGVLQRLFGQLLTSGGHGYWSENEFGNFNDPFIHQMFRETQLTSLAALNLERRSIAEIALIYDEDTALIRNWGIHHSHDMLRYSALPRVGAPYDYLELDDLLAMKDPPYKLYIFAGTGRLTSGERKAIREKIARRNRMLVWFGIPGLVNDEAQPATSEDYASALVGMQLRWRGAKKDLVALTDEGRRQLGINEKYVYDFKQLEIPEKPHRYDKYKKATYYNFFRVINPDIKLGNFADGACGFGLKRMDDWTSVYVSTTNMSEIVLRALAKLAGVHIYTESGDVFFADSRAMVIHTRTSGKKIINLRAKTHVREIPGNRAVTVDAGKFEVELPAYTTRIYFTGKAGKIDKARLRARERFDRELAERRKMRKALVVPKAADKTPATEIFVAHDGFVRDYIYAGPFLKGRDQFDIITNHNKRFKKGREWVFSTDFLKETGGEENIEPQSGMKSSDKITWRACRGLGRYVRGTDIENLDAGIHAAYAAFYLFSEKPRDIVIKTAFDDAGIVWMNSVRSEVLDGHRLDSRKFSAQTKAGWNLVLIKVFNRAGATGFAIRLADADGKPLAGARISLKRPAQFTR